MAREFAKRFYASAAWQRCRDGYIAKRRTIDGGMCETCHEQPGYIVHHTVWLTPNNIGDPSIALNHDMLRYDCLVCHNKEVEGETAPRYRFGPGGQVLPPFEQGIDSEH